MLEVPLRKLFLNAATAMYYHMSAVIFSFRFFTYRALDRFSALKTAGRFTLNIAANRFKIYQKRI